MLGFMFSLYGYFFPLLCASGSRDARHAGEIDSSFIQAHIVGVSPGASTAMSCADLGHVLCEDQSRDSLEYPTP